MNVTDPVENSVELVASLPTLMANSSLSEEAKHNVVMEATSLLEKAFPTPTAVFEAPRATAVAAALDLTNGTESKPIYPDEVISFDFKPDIPQRIIAVVVSGVLMVLFLPVIKRLPVSCNGQCDKTAEKDR